MKKILLMAAALTMLMQAPALYADDSHHPEKQGQSKAMQKGDGGGKSDMGMMKQNMHKMMKQMEEIHATKDPEKRKQLMQEHMQSMHEGMQMMKGMGGGMMMGMMGDKKGGGEMMAKGMDKNMDSNDMSQRHQMMEQRMDMMQMMMEQMMGQTMAQENVMPQSKKLHDHKSTK